MRLYLSSFDIGNASSALVALAPGGRVALIMNALDNLPGARSRWQSDQSDKLTKLGFSVEELDLRSFFGKPELLCESVQNFDMVWINGGNAFVLRRAMKLSGMDIALTDLLRRDEIVYAGFSAAAVITADSLRGLDAVDDPNAVPNGYPTEIEWNGLGILPFAIVVHYQSDHPESAAVEQEIEHYKRKSIPYRTLRDGEAFVVNGATDDIVKVGMLD